MGAPAHKPHSLHSHSVILSWSRAMIETTQQELKWDLLAKMPEVNRGEKKLSSCGVSVKEGEEAERRENKTAGRGIE